MDKDLDEMTDAEREEFLAQQINPPEEDEPEVPFLRDITDGENMTGAEKITQWWRETDSADLEMALSKREDYGSADLEVMGAAMAEMMGLETRELGLEAAFTFYALGKISRNIGALARGEQPNRDNWRDLKVYSNMAMFTRDVEPW